MEISNINHPEVNNLRQPSRDNPFVSFLKNGCLFIFLLTVIVASFWVSFRLGSRILFPAQNQPAHKIEIAIPEPPPSLAALQDAVKKAKKADPASRLSCEEKAAKVVAVKQAQTCVVSYNTRQYYKVIAGKFNSRPQSIQLVNKLNNQGFATYLKKVGQKWWVQTGAFVYKSQALKLQTVLENKGFTSSLVFEP